MPRTEEDFVRLTAVLLEVVGLRQAVGLGDPRLWRQPVSELNLPPLPPRSGLFLRPDPRGAKPRGGGFDNRLSRVTRLGGKLTIKPQADQRLFKSVCRWRRRRLKL